MYIYVCVCVCVCVCVSEWVVFYYMSLNTVYSVKGPNLNLLEDTLKIFCG
jgi:hypothetical protein